MAYFALQVALILAVPMRREILRRSALKLRARMAHSSCILAVSGLLSLVKRSALCLAHLAPWTTILLRSVS